ncbi:MAG: M28 family peptidase [Candidatus Sumerlaeia bacterium]|nr:M28 family peptidase [Candidatus Sumerlaeia bacterium]
MTTNAHRTAALLLAALLAWSPAAAQHASDAPTTATLEASAPAAPRLSALAQAFDGERAFRDVEKQLAFGPRIPGTPGHDRQINWMASELKKVGFAVEVIDLGTFRPKIAGGGVMPIRHVIARWKPERPRRILYSAHFDTRLHADSPKSTASERRLPVPGANDGGSAVAVLLEMARAIQAHPPENVGIIILMHDAEDQGYPPNMSGPHPFGEYAYGADLLAAQWQPKDRFEAGVNLDMVGEKKDPRFRKESYSLRFQPELVDEFWTLGKELYPDLFVSEATGFIIDDPVPYQQRGFPYINVIDLEYPEHHTVRDDLSAVSAETLQKIGLVSLEFIARRDFGAGEKP